MRRIVFVILSTITTLVMLFSYHTSTDSISVASSPVVQTPASSSSSTATATAPDATSGTTSGTTKAKTAPTTSAAAVTSFTGDAVDTRWGPVQVRITVQGAKITASQAVQYPQGNDRDAQINGYALPILSQEVLQVQSAAIDTVSGATVTSDGYLTSVQSAIDQAHL